MYSKVPFGYNVNPVAVACVGPVTSTYSNSLTGVSLDTSVPETASLMVAPRLIECVSSNATGKSLTASILIVTVAEFDIAPGKSTARY